MNGLNRLQSILADCLKEEYKIYLTLKALREEVENYVKQSILCKYKDSILTRDGLEFEFIGVETSFDVHNYSQKPVTMHLMYMCKSKLPKDKREKVESIKKDYLEGKYIYNSNLKVPLWHNLYYSITLENAYSGNINLRIA